MVVFLSVFDIDFFLLLHHCIYLSEKDVIVFPRKIHIFFEVQKVSVFAIFIIK